MLLQLQPQQRGLQGTGKIAHSHHICECCGTVRTETTNEKIHIVTVETPGYCNPDQAVRLFSPQAHFWLMPKKEGLFCMSWAKTFLDLPGAGKLPLSIDQTSFMPLLTCFHDADKVVKKMANPCVTDDINPQLTKQAKTLLRMHFKLGCLGF